MRSLAVISTLAVAVTATSAPAAVTFTRAYVQSRIDSSNSTTFDNDSNQLFVTDYPSGSISQTSETNLTGVNGTASGTGSTTATFDSTSAGTVNFAVSGTVAPSGNGGVVTQGFAVFFYDFVSDKAFRVRYEYEVDATSPDPFGPTAQVQVFAGGNPSPAFRLGDITAAGNVTTQLFSAGAYRVQIGHDRIVGIGRSSGDPATETLNGNVAFSINAVPEPATWATLALGFGLVGAAARRRRREALAA